MSVRGRALPQPFDQLVIRSRMAFHWRAEDLALQALTRQTLTFSRASTSTGLDRNGVAYTAGRHQTAWAIVDGRAYHRTGFGGTAETWRYSLDLRSGEGMVAYAELIDRGMGDEWLLHIGGGSTDDPSLTVRRTAGGAWELLVRHTGGLATATAPTTSTTGDRVAVFWVLTPDGAMQLRVAKNWDGDRPEDGDFAAGTEITGMTLPAAWEEPEIRLVPGGSADVRTAKLTAYRPGEALEGI